MKTARLHEDAWMADRAAIDMAAQRFWGRVQKSDECWPWIGARQPRGYGNFYVRRTFVGAHRYAWVLANGPIPDGLWVLHRCDNPQCVNPKHLFLGTALDNARDMEAKRRSRRAILQGERQWCARLTEDQVRDIYYSTDTGVAIAQQYGISSSVVYKIKKRIGWRHLDLSGDPGRPSNKEVSKIYQDSALQRWAKHRAMSAADRMLAEARAREAA